MKLVLRVLCFVSFVLFRVFVCRILVFILFWTLCLMLNNGTYFPVCACLCMFVHVRACTLKCKCLCVCDKAYMLVCVTRSACKTENRTAGRILLCNTVLESGRNLKLLFNMRQLDLVFHFTKSTLVDTETNQPQKLKIERLVGFRHTIPFWKQDAIWSYFLYVSTQFSSSFTKSDQP